MAAMAVAPPVAMPRDVGLLFHDNLLLLVLLPAAYDICQECRYHEEHGIHDPEGEAALEKAARLPRAERVCAGSRGEGDVPEGVGRSRATGLVSDKAQLVYSSDQ